jgi:non-canonical purine NTP pyrophosphatase (RdgB/HAM1 family)
MYIATTNEGKIKEIKVAFENEDVQLIPLEIDFDEVEDGLKQKGIRDMVIISKAKAIAAFEFLKQKGKELLPVIVDDAGIFFEKLGDAPGIDSKSFVKNHGGIEGVKKLIKEGDRAYFQSVLSYMEGDLIEPKSFVGKIEGHLSSIDITTEIESGLPFNHVFIPDGHDEFMYKIPLGVRAKFNHRFKAAEQLKKFLKESENAGLKPGNSTEKLR